MNNKNKQYRIEKGLLLFTQPRSPYFYGKFRINGKYVTESFAPISNFDDAKERLYEWRDEILEKENNFGDRNQSIADRDEYISFEKLDNDFQFLDVGRFDPGKRLLMREKLTLLRFMVNTTKFKLRIRLIDVLIVVTHIVSGSALSITIYRIG